MSPWYFLISEGSHYVGIPVLPPQRWKPGRYRVSLGWDRRPSPRPQSRDKEMKVWQVREGPLMSKGISERNRVCLEWEDSYPGAIRFLNGEELMWKQTDVSLTPEDPTLFRSPQKPSVPDPEPPERPIAAELSSSFLPPLCLPVPHPPRSLPDHTGLQSGEEGASRS